MPRPPAEPARAAQDGRRHAACNSLRQNLSFLAASGAPPVRSRVGAACSLTSDPLGRPHTYGVTFPHPFPILSTELPDARALDVRRPPHSGSDQCWPRAGRTLVV